MFALDLFTKNLPFRTILINNNLMSKKNKHLPPEASILDTSNPRSVINLVPEVFREAIIKIPEEFFELNVKQIWGVTKSDITLQRLRLNFWLEYDIVQETQREFIAPANVYRGICTREYFYNYIITNPKHLAIILTPPTNYRVAMDEALHVGMDKLRDIIAAPIYDKKGNFNPRAATAVMRAFEIIDMRVNGAILQRIEQKNLNVNVDATPQNSIAESPSDIQKRLVELRAQLGESPIMLPPSSNEALPIEVMDVETVKGITS